MFRSKGSVTPFLCHFPNTVSVAGIREEKQEQGTQLTHSSKAAGGGGREDLEDEGDGFGKAPTVKPFHLLSYFR